MPGGPLNQSRHHVVIVGAGFGGLEAARALRNAPVDVTVIDRQNHHCFQPLLYQVATAALSPADVAWPVRSILSNQANTRVIMGQVTGVDWSSRRVLVDPGSSIDYDYLVLASGATHSYFGREEWAAYAPGLKRIEDAREIRRRVLLAFERAEIEADARKQDRLLTFVIVGGGPTGVELAGAIAEIARHALARDFRCIDPRASRIVLIEAGPRILPAFPENLGEFARLALGRMGVNVLTGSQVTACDEQGVQIASGERIPASTIIWAAGVQASPAGSWLGVECDRAGRIEVNPDLSVPGHPNAFAIGDTASVPWEDGRVVPGIAPAAKQMGRYVGDVIAARADNSPKPGPFAYSHQGDFATIGRKAAVVSIGSVRLKGYIAWVFWSIAHIYFLIGTRNRLSVALAWAWEYLTFQRGARLISEAPKKDAVSARTAREVLEDHICLRRAGRLEEDLARNFAKDVVILTTWGCFKGHDSVRQLAANLENEAPDANLEYTKVLVDGVFGYVNWTAKGNTDIRDGADSYVVRDGKIAAQSISYSARPAGSAGRSQRSPGSEPQH